MTFLDLFAGIGGFRRGLELAGHKCVGFCEWDRFATASYTSMHLITEEQRDYLAALDFKTRQKEILKEEYRNGEWYSNDIRNVHAGSVPLADIWCFGAPCQDFSVAGHRAGLEGDRSSLVREVFRIIEELEEDKPEWLIYENVKGMLSSNNGWDYAAILSEMDRLGYDAEWQIFNSKHYGVPQNRERVYTIGHLRAKGAATLLPVEGADGKDRIQIEQIGGIPRINDPNPQAYRVYDPEGVSPTLDRMDGGGREPHIPVMFGIDSNRGGRDHDRQLCHHEISSQGSDQSETGRNGRGYYPTDCFDDRWEGRVTTLEEQTSTICARDYKGPMKVAIPVLTPDRIEKRQNGRRFKENEEASFTLTAQDRHGVAIKVKEATKQGYAEAHPGDSINLALPDSKTRRGRVGGQCAQTLDTSCNQGVLEVIEGTVPSEDHPGQYVTLEDGVTVWAVWYEKYQCYIAIRKLTPRECFRLQGWTDAYFDKAQFVNSDSQLYKQAGNGVTTTVAEAIGRKMNEV